MKKLNGYAPTIQLILFIIALVYFFGFAQNAIRSEASECAEKMLKEYQLEALETDETILRRMDRMELNLKRLCEEQGLTYIE